MAVVGRANVEPALDALNFFLADVRDGLGPYLAIYPLTEEDPPTDLTAQIMASVHRIIAMYANESRTSSPTSDHRR